MATVNFIPYRRQSAAALSRVAEYVSQEKKTADKQLVSGINCSPQFVAQEFRAVRAAHHKDSPVWFYHYTQSFSPNEPVTGQQAHQVAKEFAERAWPHSQILVATHVDARHIHSHYIVNAVCHESGYMLRQGPTTLKRLRKLSDEICQAHGLSILQPNPPRHMVSSLLHHGVDKQTVAELAGHADTSFLERTYCHPQMELKRQAANVMTDVLLHSA